VKEERDIRSESRLRVGLRKGVEISGNNKGASGEADESEPGSTFAVSMVFWSLAIPISMTFSFFLPVSATVVSQRYFRSIARCLLVHIINRIVKVVLSSVFLFVNESLR